MTITPEQTVVACLVLHVLSDFPLQTVGKPSLADLKQKAWWDELLDKGVADARYGSDTARRAARSRLERKYGRDHKAALWCHSLVWSALTFLPFCTTPGWSAIVAANAWIHYIVDDLKANQLRINLLEDQTIHLLQIVLTLGAFWSLQWILGGWHD